MRRLLALLLVGAAAVARAADAPPDAWAKILAARVNPAGQIAFRTLARENDKDLARYLDFLAAAYPETLDHDGVIAFWLNAYHALMLSAVAHGENPSGLEGRARMYHWYGHTIAGKRQTLDDIRATLDRYAASDARIHLAISDGTRGGAALAAEPYVAERIDAQLAAAARRFATDLGKVRLGHGDWLELSRIFEWYRKDFDREAGSVIAFLRPLVADPALQRALAKSSPTILFIPYDWELAAAAGEQPSP